jgi:hypothetical protein
MTFTAQLDVFFLYSPFRKGTLFSSEGARTQLLSERFLVIEWRLPSLMLETLYFGRLLTVKEKLWKFFIKCLIFFPIFLRMRERTKAL